MDQLKLHHLEKLLEVPTARGPVQANDISVLTCGCLVSESEYTLENANPEEGICPHCSKIGQILAPIAIEGTICDVERAQSLPISLEVPQTFIFKKKYPG